MGGGGGVMARDRGRSGVKYLPDYLRVYSSEHGGESRHSIINHLRLSKFASDSVIHDSLTLIGLVVSVYYLIATVG